MHLKMKPNAARASSHKLVAYCLLQCPFLMSLGATYHFLSTAASFLAAMWQQHHLSAAEAKRECNGPTLSRPKSPFEKSFLSRAMAHCHYLLSTLLCRAGFAQWVAETMSCYSHKGLPLPGAHSLTSSF